MLVGLFVFVRTTRAVRLMNGWAVFAALLTKGGSIYTNDGFYGVRLPHCLNRELSAP